MHQGRTADQRVAFRDREKPSNVRANNVLGGKQIAGLLRGALGPRGMYTMLVEANGNTTVTNDGATILKQLKMGHPIGKIFRQLSMAQDVEAGDGTTSVVVLAGALLGEAERLLERGIHPALLSAGFSAAGKRAVQAVRNMSVSVDAGDRDALVSSATTALGSKLVSYWGPQLAAMSVDTVLSIADNSTGSVSIDLKDIKIVKCLGANVESSELLSNGIVLTQHASHAAGGPTRVENPKIALVQFCISPPKTDVDSQIVVRSHEQIDRIMREQREYILDICQKIHKTGCNVLLVQKSILRDALSDLALHYLARMKIAVVPEIERNDVAFIVRALGCKPIADIEAFTKDRLGGAELFEERVVSEGLADEKDVRIVKISGVRTSKRKTATVVLRGHTQLTVDETERSFYDALCVVRSLVREPAIVAGGGSPQCVAAAALVRAARAESNGTMALCLEAFGRACETIPTALAENAGMDAVATLATLRQYHAVEGSHPHAGVSLRRRAAVENMMGEDVVEPLHTVTSMLEMATECAASILKVDDVVIGRR